ncbi:hypothetical protein [Methylobacterium aerolatum]|uniref:Cytochrome P450 n=1 Tax=Methylobacterium aerolatum TaxID=418708 RepID=A0ABU0HVJ2_9HYPH|nr:hypothetical protein [Methylobacterium aerolatum]MDQ0446360.1 cytochrome P450 [Methylobacterium aerolatum]
MPTLFPREEAELRAVWAGATSMGRWRSLATRRGRLRADELRKLVREIVKARQADMFAVQQTIEDLLGLLAEAAERKRD